MPISRVTCPECEAGLKSASGFTPGQTVRCPKCDTVFEVEGPDGRPVRAAEDDRPARKPKRKRKKKAGGSAPLVGFVVLGVLVVVLGVAGVLLYKKNPVGGEGADGPMDAAGTPDDLLAKVAGGGKADQPAGFIAPYVTDPAKRAEVEAFGRWMVGRWRGPDPDGDEMDVVLRADGTLSVTIRRGKSGEVEKGSGRWHLSGVYRDGTVAHGDFNVPALFNVDSSLFKLGPDTVTFPTGGGDFRVTRVRE